MVLCCAILKVVGWSLSHGQCCRACSLHLHDQVADIVYDVHEGSNVNDFDVKDFNERSLRVHKIGRVCCVGAWLKERCYAYCQRMIL